jgi:Ca-activated chloride channel family protein
VDKAAYSNVRRFINDGQKPPADAVRIEEMINYFDYEYPQPADDHPFAIFTEMSECPWQAEHKLLHIGVQGKKIATEKLPPSNIVFLIDVSGSMDEDNKLPLVKSAFKLLVNNLREKDRVAIITYAGSTEIVLGSTPGNKKKEIIAAIDKLGAGGCTAGGAGIVMAYQVARENFIKGGNNRVILATDGDFNVGASSDGDMETLITKERKSGVFLSCLGFGMGNYKDSKLETLADKGNGNHAYIDNLQEANKTFGSEFGGTLFTIAKDVKIQIEFNPTKVQAYRLVGYENRLLNDEDFKDDTKDAGELGSGHTATALYEIIPVGVENDYEKNVPDLKYQKPIVNQKATESDEVATIKMRYKKPDGNNSIEMEKVITDEQKSIGEASDNLKFSSAVAMFGMLLRDSEFKGDSDYQTVIDLADDARGYDKEGYKAEFVRLVRTCSNLASNE